MNKPPLHVYVVAAILICFWQQITLNPVHGANTSAPTIEVTSSNFARGGIIPKAFTADGQNASPALSWSGLPKETEALAIIADDPDAPSGDFIHWLVYDIPASETGIRGGIPPGYMLPNGTKQGLNSYHKIGYDGPAPPAGKVHRYVFTVYALDAKLGVQPGIGLNVFKRAIAGHILGYGQLLGKYSR